jgi:hypothetical protein
MSYADRLKKMTKKMKEQQADYTPGGRKVITDGEYNFRVKAVIDEWPAKDADGENEAKPARLYIGFQFTVDDDGDNLGRSAYVNCGLEEKVGSQIGRGIIEDLGYEWPEEDMSQLETICENITERAPLVRGTARTKKNKQGYDNTKITID